MWLLIILMTFKFWISEIEALPSGCKFLQSSKTNIECEKPSPDEFPSNTEQLSITKGDWPGLKDYVLRLKSLRHLKLFDMGESFNGILPDDSFANLTSLEKLDLSGNSFVWFKTNHAFRGLSNLKELDLSHSLDGSLYTLPGNLFIGLSSLETLKLNYGNFYELDHKVFAGLTNLQKLYCKNMHVLQYGPEIFGPLKNLQFLDIAHSVSYQVFEPDTFKSLVNLKELRLKAKDTKRDDLPATLFSGLSNLERLHLELQNDKVVPATLFSGLRNLETLRLATEFCLSYKKCHVPSTLLTGLLNLKHIDLEDFYGSHIPDITGLVNLQSLKYPSSGRIKCSCNLLSTMNSIKSKVINGSISKCKLVTQGPFDRLDRNDAANVFDLSCSDIPVPPLFDDFMPSVSKIQEESFTIELAEFDEIDGKIRNYDVIVKNRDEHDGLLYPYQYSNDDIASEKFGLYIAHRITNRMEFGTKIIIGKVVSKRRRNVLGTIYQRALIPGTQYSVFLRGYINDTAYQSTSWYKLEGGGSIFKTLGTKPVKDGGFARWKVAVIVVVVVLVIISVAAIVIYKVRQRNYDICSTNEKSVPVESSFAV